MAKHACCLTQEDGGRIRRLGSERQSHVCILSIGSGQLIKYFLSVVDLNLKSLSCSETERVARGSNLFWNSLLPALSFEVNTWLRKRASDWPEFRVLWSHLHSVGRVLAELESVLFCAAFVNVKIFRRTCFFSDTVGKYFNFLKSADTCRVTYAKLWLMFTDYEGAGNNRRQWWWCSSDFFNFELRPLLWNFIGLRRTTTAVVERWVPFYK